MAKSGLQDVIIKAIKIILTTVNTIITFSNEPNKVTLIDISQVRNTPLCTTLDLNGKKAFLRLPMYCRTFKTQNPHYYDYLFYYV